MKTIDWSAIRADYENGLSLRALAEKHGIPKSVIGRQKHKEQWDTGTFSDTQRGTNDPPNRDVNAALRVAEALKLRAQKLTYAEIAQHCGYANAKSAHRAIQRELDRVVVPNVKELRHEEAYMYQIGHSEIWQLFMDKKNRGRLFAWDRILATSEAYRKLMGLDVKNDDVLSAQVVVREVPQGFLNEEPKV